MSATASSPDDWRYWHHNPKDMARFVTAEASRRVPLGASTVDLRARHPDNPRGEVARAIYEALAASNIHYAPERTDPGRTATQPIRNPADVMDGRRGTCLDLAALFCGVCLDHDLIPLLLVLVDDKGQRHSLAAISLTHDLHAVADHRRPLYRELAAPGNASLFSDGPRLLQAIDARQYLALECTGFAIAETLDSPGGHPRRGGRLDFDTAAAEARALLAGGRFHLQFALDIGIAKSAWGLPEPPPLPTWEAWRPGRDEDEAIRDYLEWFESDVRPRAWSDLDRYVTPGTTEIAAPAGVAQAADPVIAEAIAHRHIRRTLWVLNGTFDGGDMLTAPLAAFARKGRRVHRPEALLHEMKAPMVLLGEPGSGKTVTLWEIGQEVVRRARASRRPVLPVYVPLRSFEANRLDVRPADVWTLVVGAIPPEFPEIRAGLTRLNRQGRLTILFDGLNEMPRFPDDAEIYRAKVDALGAFPKLMATRSRIVISCRTNDFSYRLHHRVVALLPFDFDQVREYIRENIKAIVVNGEEVRDPGSIAMRLMQAGALGEAATNPLILSLCRLYLSQERTWPSSRQEVFRFYVEWNASEAIVAERGSRDDVAALAAPLVAAWQRLAFTLSHESRRAFQEDEPVAQADPEAVRLGLKRGLLLRDPTTGPRTLMFAHHRLQEFLAAWRIAEAPEVAAGLSWQSLLPIPRWQEILVDAMSRRRGSVEAALSYLVAALDDIGAEFSELSRRLGEAVAEKPRLERELASILPDGDIYVGQGRSIPTYSREKTIRRIALEEKIGKVEARIKEVRFGTISAANERRHADLISLAARVVGAGAATSSARLAPGLMNCIRLMSEHGRAETQVQMLRAWADAGEACPRDVVESSIESKNLWVRRQALAVLSMADRPFNLGQELAHDWARGRLLATMPTHLRAAAGRPRRRRGFLFVSACYLAFATGVVAMATWLCWTAARSAVGGPSGWTAALAALAATLWAGLACGRGRGDFWRQYALASGAIAGLQFLLTRPDFNAETAGATWRLAEIYASLAVPLAILVAARLLFWACFTAAIVPLCLALGQPILPCYRVARDGYPPDVEQICVVPLLFGLGIGTFCLVASVGVMLLVFAVVHFEVLYRSVFLVLGIFMAIRMIRSWLQTLEPEGSGHRLVIALSWTAVPLAMAAAPPRWWLWPLINLAWQILWLIGSSMVAVLDTLLAPLTWLSNWLRTHAAGLFGVIWRLFCAFIAILCVCSMTVQILKWTAAEARAYARLLDRFGWRPADVSSPGQWAEEFRRARKFERLRLLAILRGRIGSPDDVSSARWAPAILLETLDAVEADVDDLQVARHFHGLRNELYQMTRQER